MDALPDADVFAVEIGDRCDFLYYCDICGVHQCATDRLFMHHGMIVCTYCLHKVPADPTLCD